MSTTLERVVSNLRARNRRKGTDTSWAEIEARLVNERESVLHGAEVLDHVCGDGWRDEINVARLRQRSPTCCVLGQVFSSYVDGLCTLNQSIVDDELLPANWQTVLGFTRGSPVDYTALTIAWVEHLTGERFEDIHKPEPTHKA